MSELASHRAVIELWETREALAAELGEDSRMISKWWQRRRIPGIWWARIVALPKSAENSVTLDLLATLASREREVA